MLIALIWFIINKVDPYGTDSLLWFIINMVYYYYGLALIWFIINSTELIHIVDPDGTC